ncbi:hypothetical protein ABVT39_019854 [Epinephelus coioides]
MRVNIFSCLLAIILGCNITAAIIQRVVEENGIILLECPDSVEGTVTWSRESNGNKIEILTCDGEQDKRHIHDPERRYRSFGKKLLYITRVIISDTGRYFCNDEPAVELMVNPAATPYLWQMCVRTVIGILYLIIMISITVTTWRKEIIPKVIKEKDSITLLCPHSVDGNVTWSRERNRNKVDILRVEYDRDIRLIHDPYKRFSSLADKSLHIRRVYVSDTARYFCNNKPAARLTVISSEILHKIVEEKTSATLRCPHSVEGNVIWSRESHGNKTDILTVNGDGDLKHIHDPGKLYSSLADKSLVIRRVTISDSGRYLCNNEPAVELTVIPSGTIRLNATEGTTITLTCPLDVGGSVPTWSRGSGEIQQEKGFYVSPLDNTLTIKDVQLRNSGLYYCGKPAVYLNVIKAASKDHQPVLRLVCGVVFSFLVLVIIIIFIIYFTQRRRLKRQGNEERFHVYDEIQDGFLLQPTNGGGSLAEPTATYCMAGFSAGSNQNDPSYSTIPDLPPVQKTTNTSLHIESPYSLIGNTLTDEKNKGFIHEVVEEKKAVSLQCPHPVMGKVTWSREIRGSNVDILSADGDGQKRINDPGKHYDSQADEFRSLYISRTNVSDSGRYLCNNEPAVELTVIPSGTITLQAAVGTNINLTCPFDVSGTHLPTWTRQNSGRKFSENQMGQMLTLTDVQSDDTGLYYCDGKPAAYLTVKDDQSKRGSGEQAATVYAEISDGSVFEPAQEISQPNEPIYSLIDKPN